jgi:hypothetical protein
MLGFALFTPTYANRPLSLIDVQGLGSLTRVGMMPLDTLLAHLAGTFAMKTCRVQND